MEKFGNSVICINYTFLLLSLPSWHRSPCFLGNDGGRLNQKKMLPKNLFRFSLSLSRLSLTTSIFFRFAYFPLGAAVSFEHDVGKAANIVIGKGISRGTVSRPFSFFSYLSIEVPSQIPLEIRNLFPEKEGKRKASSSRALLMHVWRSSHSLRLNALESIAFQ